VASGSPRPSNAPLSPVSYVRNKPIKVLPTWLPTRTVMRWLRSKYHALSSLRAPQPYPPSTYKDTTTRIPSLSSIRALLRNCSLATPKHNYVHYDTCRSRCANTWASPRMTPTHSHVPQLPFLLLPTLTLPCGLHSPRAGITPVPGKTRTVLAPSAIPCLTANLPPGLSLSSAYTAHLGPNSRRRRYPTRRN
jgi:hypothetical protein